METGGFWQCAFGSGRLLVVKIHCRKMSIGCQNEVDRVTELVRLECSGSANQEIEVCIVEQDTFDSYTWSVAFECLFVWHLPTISSPNASYIKRRAAWCQGVHTSVRMTPYS